MDARRSRSTWWLRFGLLLAMCTAWALGLPLFAAPDEPSHIVKAQSVMQGVLLPDRIPDSRYQLVPAAMRLESAHASVPCIQFRPQQDASCVRYHGTNEVRDIPTLVGRYPPALYAFIGLPTIITTSAVAVYAMRLLFALITAACAASALADLDVLGGVAARFGFLIALTPMTLFLSGTVNPSAAEIAAAMLVWASSARLLAHGQHQTPDIGTIHRCGAAALFLVITRPLSPLWLGCIALVVALAYGRRSTFRELARHGTFRIWAVVVVVVAAVQTAWVVFLDAVYGDAGSATDWSLAESIRLSFGRLQTRLDEMIGVFGWADTPSPSATRLAWFAAIAAISATAFVRGGWRYRIAAAVLLVLVTALPVAIEVSRARELGLSWYGRYTLPLAVGVPLLAGLALARAPGISPFRHPRVSRALAMTLATGHVLAFHQMLRRYSVGSDGPIIFFSDARWDPPVPAIVLLAGYAAAVGVFVWRLTGDSDGESNRRRVA